MMILGWLLKLFSSPVITSVAGYFTKKMDDAVVTHQADTAAATQIVVAQMQAEVAARQASAAVAGKHNWIVSFLGAAFVFHIWMITLDSVFHLNWAVSALPKPMDEWEGHIVLALCAAGPISSISNRLIAKVWK